MHIEVKNAVISTVEVGYLDCVSGGRNITFGVALFFPGELGLLFVVLSNSIITR